MARAVKITDAAYEQLEEMQKTRFQDATLGSIASLAIAKLKESEKK